MTQPAPALEPLKDVPQPWEAFDTTIRRAREEQQQRRRTQSTRKITFLDWARLAPTGRGPLDFKEFAWQKEMYSEGIAHADEVATMKATQVGLSEMSTRLALFHADVYQRIMIYTFPVEKDLLKFSKQRMGPMIKKSPHLIERMRGNVNTVELKQFGEGGFVYFFGLQSPIDSTDGDGLIVDEFDDSDPENFEKSLPRITGPMSLGMLRMLGVPLIPGKGIALKYKESDQRVWTVKCTSCSTWNHIRGIQSFEQNLDQEALHLVCKKCRRFLDVRTGQWVATFPDRDRIGYSVSKLLVTSKRTLALLVDSSKKKAPHEIEAFRQRGLGEEYASADARLSLEQVKACVVDDLRPLEKLASGLVVTMGVDTASTRGLNVTIEEAVDAQRGRKVYVGVVDGTPAERFQELCRLIIAYGVTMTVIDKGPEGMFAQSLAAAFPGRVYQGSFFDAQPGTRAEPEVWTLDHQKFTVSLWRTRVYDFTFARYRTKEVLLPPLNMIHPDFAEHMGNLLRVVEQDPETMKLTIRYRRIGPEDFAQCEAYNTAARELVRLGFGLSIASAAGVSLTDQFATPYDEEERDEGIAQYESGFGPDFG